MPPKAVSGVDTERSIIPSSRRPDGSLRKPIQVKPGFIPVEDQIAFVSSRIKGMDIVVGGGDRKLKSEETGLSAAALKNLRRKERKQAASGQEIHPDGTSTMTDHTVVLGSGSTIKENENKSTEAIPKPIAVTEPTEVTIEKQLRNLQKKLRKIDELVAKQKDGGVLDSAQLEKITKRKEVENDIARLSGSLSL